ncbi:leucyl/phenylalanyl-tRNA--protein transferase [Sphingobium sufflavum]|uniref:leucyl/phenylalanyl-tRNA--protein transferase n=1 Tax=Sphingobium sufflavum TaxID=1129547 RepID=UPI002DD43DE8|nr:leucyl/phenylalanyl-tRNA--protein transferase [Sphingobium sufflavum]
MLLRAYGIGIFPMSHSADDPDIFWVEPRRRAILPLDALHVSRSLRKTIRADRFRVTADRAFAQVVQGCAAITGDRQDTWINEPIFEACRRLHAMGHAHSIECWEGDELVGGLYGISLGRAFFGESMFSRRTDASKVALAWLVARLKAGGFALLDCQFMTDHLASMGAREISGRAYSALLAPAVAESVPGLPDVGAGDFSALDGLAAPSVPGFLPDGLPSPDAFTVSGPVSGQLIVQLLTQTS